LTKTNEITVHANDHRSRFVPLLVLELPRTITANSTATRSVCPVESMPTVAAEYLEYHAMVAPLMVLPDTATALASCPQRKVIRT
jgi:hypothetical protein